MPSGILIKDMPKEVVLKFDHVLKQFGSIKALKEVSFEIFKGEVHCLVGENGAGKSTLMKILSGAYDIDGGSIYIEGEKKIINNPAKAAELGIAVVYQEMNTVNKLSITDNILLGRENTKYGLNFEKKNKEEVKPYLDMVGLDKRPSELMEKLSIAQKQMVMIAKALSQNAKIIVLDEPTAMLNEVEVKILFSIIAKLKSKGITIIYISHRMEEIYQIGDRVSILKDGGYVGTYETNNIPVEKLIVKMVGRELKEVYPKKDRKRGRELLRVENLFTDKLQNVSFTLYEGEVLGLSGLVGAGRTEILRAIFGVDQCSAGKIFIRGKEVKITNPKDAIKQKIGFVPEDRKIQGVVNCLSVKENLTLVYSQIQAKRGFLNRALEQNITDSFIRQLKIKTSGMEQTIGNLSGGNQQKVVLSKWLSINPQIMLLDEPTQGIDVGAKAEIYQVIDHLSREGIGILLVSSDLVEIINLCNRIIVMREGCVSGEVKENEMTEDHVMLYAMGVNKDEKNKV